jgi:hypothetical protein
MRKVIEYIRDDLIRKINSNHVLWSYQKKEKDCIIEDLLIEKTLVHLDIDDIEKLFLLYPMNKVIPDNRFHSMNLLFAYLYFNIKKPAQYLERKRKGHYEKLASL